MNLTFKEKAQRFVTTKVLDSIIQKARSGDLTDLAKLFENIAALAPASYHRKIFREIAALVRENHPYAGVFRRIARELNPNSLQKILQNLMVNFMVLGRGIRDRKMRELGVHLPNFLTISPTMRCNLSCEGCYASEYDQDQELSYEVLDRIISEGKELGMFFHTLSGGEVLLHSRIFDIWEKHRDCYFQFYTNGTLLSEQIIERLAALGNVAPMISVEGSRESTETRRGKGSYDIILKAFETMKRAGMAFGFSATYTNRSADSIASDTFIRTMRDAGCYMGWIFQYVPIGKTPDLSYMATPQQRTALHLKVREWRKNPEFPVFVGDFWNDGPHVDGCMAGGQKYWHIIANGDVEPCVFVPFAVDNIHGKSLVDIARSPFFAAIREAQPYDDDNLLRPCMVIDHPHVLREIVEKHQARPCHPGLEAILQGKVAAGLESYARGVREALDPLWEASERREYLKALEKEDNPAARQRFEKRYPLGAR